MRNCYLPKRKLVMPVGELAIEQPRVHNRRPADQREIFRSKLLPPYLRETKSIEELIPYLYLKGISTGDFQEALSATLGPECPGLSATTIIRLKSVWEEQYQQWASRSSAEKEYVYVWADGIHTNIRLEEHRQNLIDLGWMHPEGRSYPPTLFTRDGDRYIYSLVFLRAGGGHKPPVWICHDRAAGSSFDQELSLPIMPDTALGGEWLLYGCQTSDNLGNFYIVGA